MHLLLPLDKMLECNRALPIKYALTSEELLIGWNPGGSILYILLANDKWRIYKANSFSDDNRVAAGRMLNLVLRWSKRVDILLQGYKVYASSFQVGNISCDIMYHKG